MKVFLILLSLITQFPDVEYDPFVAELIGQVSADSVTATIAAISGEVPVSIGGGPDSLATRWAYSPGSYRAALWLAEQLESEGLEVELMPFIPIELSDVDLLPCGEGWACGSDGHAWTNHGNRVFHTADAGASWEPVSGIEGYGWEALVAASADSVWVASNQGRVLRTINAALSWEEMRFGGSGLYDVFALDSRHGWAVGDSGTILSTDDAWENYTEERVVPEDLRFIFFISQNHGWIASDSSLWRTTDGGENWEYLAHEVEKITGFYFIDTLQGYLIGDRGDTSGPVDYTADGGHTWEARLDTVGNVLHSIKVLGGDTIWIAGEGGYIGCSPDGGLTWHLKSTPSRARINAIDISADGRLTAVGAEDIFYSPDGEVWQRADTANLGLMWNVVATLPGQSPYHHMILVTAHYDARSEDNERYTPGADDNGSGVAAVIECARVLARHSWRHTLKFVLFSGEEVGLFGSHRYVTEAVGTRDSILAVLNADMFAYDGNGDAAIDVNSNPDDALAQAAGSILMDVIEVYDIDLAPTHYVEDAARNSDHYYFWQERIPAVFLGEDRYDFNPFYHSTGDLLSELNPAHIGEGVRACVGWVAHMAGLDSLVEIKEPPAYHQEQVSLKLSSSLLRSSGWLEVSAPYSITPIIYDASGRRVEALATIPASPQSVRIPLEVSDLPSGVYWISIQGTKGSVSEKFVRVR